jgi:hypothetical protein
MVITSDIAAVGVVIREPNSARIAVLTLLIGVTATAGTAAGFSTGSALWGIVAALSACLLDVALLALMFRWTWLRTKTMSAMHGITRL